MLLFEPRAKSFIFASRMLYDGIGYLVALTGINIFNLILFKRSQDIQTAAASLGYCVSWIMSQRLLIHLYDASRERREESLEGAEVTITKNIGTAREVSRVVRAQLDRKNTGSSPFELARRPRSSSVTEESYYHGEGEEPAVSVRIEKTMKMQTFSRTYELEDYSRRSRR
ncbi:hypothetical protein CPC08DRAFT_229301 [Agrocybe pediades]|nr:hypothetical protein CPC08DRAFT_229301 [Agrocybe pediades]